MSLWFLSSFLGFAIFSNVVCLQIYLMQKLKTNAVQRDVGSMVDKREQRIHL